MIEPLGMGDTGSSLPAAKFDRLAPAYWTNFDTGALELYDPAEGGQWSRPPAFSSGGGGLVSTIHDYLAFRPDDAELRPARQPAHPFAAVG